MTWIAKNILQVPAPLGGHEAAQRRISDPAYTFVRNIAMVIDPTGNLGKSLSATDIYELAESNDVSAPGWYEPNSDQGPRRVGGDLGRILGQDDIFEIDGFMLEKKSQSFQWDDGKGAREMKVYEFTRLPHTPEHAPSKAHLTDSTHEPDNPSPLPPLRPLMI